MKERLFRNQRIHLSGEFMRFRSSNASEFTGLFFILKVLGSGHGVSRLGMIVTKRVGNAVVRNRVRRVMREIFRRKLQKLVQNCDYLVIAKRMIVDAPHEKIESELLKAASIAHERERA
ncbi:MAG: ribonuclease P protein component [Puniceicoccales bacterium]|nr:ribonuclease P protein component [Puniceicoccales bacterium]